MAKRRLRSIRTITWASRAAATSDLVSWFFWSGVPPRNSPFHACPPHKPWPIWRKTFWPTRRMDSSPNWKSSTVWYNEGAGSSATEKIPTRWRGNLRASSPKRPRNGIGMQAMQVATKYRDPLRRLTPTPLVTDLSIMGRKVRLESNSAALFSGIATLFERCSDSSTTPPDFLWRLIGEIDSGSNRSWPEMAAFSDEGLRYVNLGQRN